MCGPDLTIERGYGGYPGAHGTTETELIVMLARAPELILTTWEIGYSGDGYSGGQVAAGANAAELLIYLEEQPLCKLSEPIV